MSWESFNVVRFDLGPLLQGQTRIPNLKVLITSLLLVLEVCNVKPTNRKSWAGNLLVWSDLTLGSPLLITCLLLVLEVCNVKPTYRKSWAGNLLMCSDFSLGPSFKVKRG